MSVGMPQHLKLQLFGYYVLAAFGERPFHVGSSLDQKTGWRDVDVRLMLPDEQYEALGLGDPQCPHHSEKWQSLCLAFSALGRELTGLPIDFQIQQRTLANEDYKGLRSALGLMPWMWVESATEGGDHA